MPTLWPRRFLRRHYPDQVPRDFLRPLADCSVRPPLRLPQNIRVSAEGVKFHAFKYAQNFTILHNNCHVGKELDSRTELLYIEIGLP
jgi:hypothetical protein